MLENICEYELTVYSIKYQRVISAWFSLLWWYKPSWMVAYLPIYSPRWLHCDWYIIIPEPLRQPCRIRVKWTGTKPFTTIYTCSVWTITGTNDDLLWTGLLTENFNKIVFKIHISLTVFNYQNFTRATLHAETPLSCIDQYMHRGLTVKQSWPWSSLGK